MINCREVEDFARRLNSDWPQRMQEILSLGQDRRLVQVSMNGNCSSRRCTSKLFPGIVPELVFMKISAFGHCEGKLLWLLANIQNTISGF